VSFESLLQFWTVHNRQIIEFVFVSTFVLILFVIYRQFFSKSESHGGASASTNTVSIDTSEIEEKLKKILENQVPLKAAEPTGQGPTTISDTSGDAKELEKLRAELKEKDKTIEEIRKGIASAPAPGASKEEIKKFEDKIKELEGRLSEYEIISEDIADLSFYKEENARLQKELAAGGKAAATAAPVAAPTAAAEPVAAMPVPDSALAKAAEQAKIEELAAQVDTSTAVQASAPVAGTTEAASSASDSIVDDDILKEFAAAVEGQKAAEKEAAPTPQPTDAQKLTESKELMGEFENFIKKG
jgi:hypothetical protein